MKNLVARLLLNLAAKEEESKTLGVQVEALEMVVATLISKLDAATQQGVIVGIEDELNDSHQQVREPDVKQLRHSVEKLLLQSRV